MLVKDWMSTNVITLNVNDTMQDAINVSMEHHISLMPVMEEGKLVGIVTDRDLKRAPLLMPRCLISSRSCITSLAWKLAP